MGKGASKVLEATSGVLGVASPVLGIGLGIAGAIQAGKEKRDAQEALENYQRQELKNVAEGLQVSTLGSDLQREEQARLASGQIGALREGGARTLIGGLGRVEAGNQRVMRETGANLDMQQKQIDQIQAEDDARIRTMQENREIGDLSALSSQYQAGKQDQQTGFGNIIQGTGMLSGALKQLAEKNNTSDGYGLSGSGINNVNSDYQTPDSMRFAQESGYATPPVLTNPSYNPQNFGPQNNYGFFNRYPYQPLYGPQNN